MDKNDIIFQATEGERRFLTVKRRGRGTGFYSPDSHQHLTIVQETGRWTFHVTNEQTHYRQHVLATNPALVKKKEFQKRLEKKMRWLVRRQIRSEGQLLAEGVHALWFVMIEPEVMKTASVDVSQLRPRLASLGAAWEAERGSLFFGLDEDNQILGVVITGQARARARIRFLRMDEMIQVSRWLTEAIAEPGHFFLPESVAQEAVDTHLPATMNR